MTENKIDMKTNNYLSKNINFLTPWPPKYNINLLKKPKFFLTWSIEMKYSCALSDRSISVWKD